MSYRSVSADQDIFEKVPAVCSALLVLPLMPPLTNVFQFVSIIKFTLVENVNVIQGTFLLAKTASRLLAQKIVYMILYLIVAFA